MAWEELEGGGGGEVGGGGGEGEGEGGLGVVVGEMISIIICSVVSIDEIFIHVCIESAGYRVMKPMNAKQKPVYQPYLYAFFLDPVAKAQISIV